MKRNYEDGAGGGFGGGPQSKRPPPRRTRLCMKVLCPDNLVWQLMGPKGVTKDQIQTETGSKLVFSNKDDYYPSTRYRVLGIYADDERPILGTLERVLTRAVESGREEERTTGRSTPNPDYLGKEPGEFVVRLAISKVTSGELIGRGGQRIKDLRAETGTKVFIENETICGHQMVRVIGRPEQIKMALAAIVDVSQGQGDTEEFHAWAALLNFSEGEAPVISTRKELLHPSVPPPAAAWGPPPMGEGGGKARRARGGRNRGGKGGDGWQGEKGGPDGGEPAPWDPDDDKPLDQAQIDAMIEDLAGAVDSLPPDTAGLSYSLSFDLALCRFEAIKLDGREAIQTATGADLDMEAVPESDDPNGAVPVSAVGPLLSIYAAHAMILQKVREIERQEEAEIDENEDLSREELIAKIKDLQAQLAEARKLGFVPS